MKREYFTLVFLFCYLTKAYFLSINYTLSHEELSWNGPYQLYPVLYGNSTIIMQNGDVCLAFYPFRKAFGIYLRIQNEEPLKLWDSNASVSFKSRLFLNSTGALVLVDDLRKEVWSAGPGITRWEMQATGTLMLYDKNNTRIWQSIDYLLPDVVVPDHYFTRISTESSSVVIENGKMTVKGKNNTTLCTLDSRGSITFDNQPVKIRTFNENTTINADGSMGIAYIYFYLDFSELPSYSMAFIKLQESGSFLVSYLSSSSWKSQLFTCCSCYSSESRYGCSSGYCNSSFNGSIPLLCMLVAALIITLCSEVRYILLAKFNQHTLFQLFLFLAPYAATLPSSILVIISNVRDYNNRVPLFFIAIDAIILQISNRGLFQFRNRNPLYRRKLLISLISLHYIAIFMACVLSTLYLLIADPKLRHTYALTLYIYGYDWICLAFLLVYSLAIFNTILLIVARFPCCSRYSSKKCYLGLVFANIILAGTSIPIIVFSFGKHSSKVLVGQYPIMLWEYYGMLNIILVATSVWGSFVHGILTNVAIFIYQPVRSGIQILLKKTHIWLLTRLLGRPGPPEDDDIVLSVTNYSYPEMEVVTNHFGKQIGRGGFGGVYQGMLLDGTNVAVKKLESSSQGRQEFKSEIEILGKLHHIHLVQLLGFCAEGTHKLLLYEFMSNGSLDRWIFNDHCCLDWAKRMKIILGTAQGLAYLHEECSPRILHLDVKPQNILLDESFTPKVADFGLCRLMPPDQSSLMLTRLMGTFGYLPPEWTNGSVSEKSDVYSFGIVVLEIVSGRRSYSTTTEEEMFVRFVRWAADRNEEGTLLDSKLAKECFDVVELKRVVEVALWCVRNDPNDRPSMAAVVQMLQANIDDTLPQQQAEYPIDRHAHLCVIDKSEAEEIPLRRTTLL